MGLTLPPGNRHDKWVGSFPIEYLIYKIMTNLTLITCMFIFTVRQGGVCFHWKSFSFSNVWGSGIIISCKSLVFPVFFFRQRHRFHHGNNVMETNGKHTPPPKKKKHTHTHTYTHKQCCYFIVIGGTAVTAVIITTTWNGTTDDKLASLQLPVFSEVAADHTNAVRRRVTPQNTVQQGTLSLTEITLKHWDCEKYDISNPYYGG